MRNRSGPKTEHYGTPERIMFQDKHWPSGVTHCFLLSIVSKSCNILIYIIDLDATLSQRLLTILL